MRILILGGDGYLGWPTAMHFSNRGHEVHVVDNYLRRAGPRRGRAPTRSPRSPPACPSARRRGARSPGRDRRHRGRPHRLGGRASACSREFRPEAVVHYGEMPCGPVLDEGPRARRVHADEQRGQHAERDVRHRGLRARRPPGEARHHGRVRHARTSTSRRATSRSSTTAARTRCRSPSCPGSFYHLSKVHDSHNIHFACRIWGLRATDLNQGVVYGIETEETQLDPRLATRFDYDEVFGTALNRFCLQAVIGHPLTVYGEGGQTRGYLNIVDTLQCVELAALNPADRGRVPGLQPVHRAVLGQRARRARAARPAREYGLEVDVEHLENPRVETEEHYYNAKHTEAARPRPEAAPAVRDADRVDVRRDPASTRTA